MSHTRQTAVRRLTSTVWAGATWVLMGYFAIFHVQQYLPFGSLGGLGYDAHAYWLAGNVNRPYGATPGTADAFLYTPAFRQAIWPLTQLPWPAFFAIWVAIETAVFVWLVKPLPVRWAVPLFLLAVPELLRGNIAGLLCVALVLGVTRPWAWSLPLLTKIVPGVLGVVYLAASGTFRRAVGAVGVTLTVVAVSVLLSPDLWVQWVDFITTPGAGDARSSALIRATIAALVVVIAGFFRQSWLLAPAVMLSTPVFGLHPEHAAFLLAIPRLVLHDRASIDG